MIDKNDLEDIFGIPVDGSHLDLDNGSSDDVAFGNVTPQNSGAKSFDEQVSSLSKDMSSIAKPYNIRMKDSSIENIKISNGGDTNELQSKEDGDSTRKNDGHINSINSGSDSKISSKPNKITGDNSSDRSISHKIQVDSHSKELEDQKVGIISINGWNVKNDSLVFCSFYAMKQDALSGWLLPGGEINFLHTQEELVHERVDLSTIEFGDLHSMFDALKNVQHWKDRVTEISLRVNAQYYSWKRAVELFRGSLARLYYEKPAEKQDGVVMEHMGDMLRYYSQIEALHANVDAVTRNLDNAFDCISRQITVSIPYGQKEADTVEKRVSKTMASKPDLSDSFADIVRSADSLPEKTYIPPRMVNRDIPVSKKIGTVNWSDI